MEYRDKEHFLALKVMRLTRPSLFSNSPVSCDLRDLPGNIWEKELNDDIGFSPVIKNYGVGNLLLLPQSFGNIYLGETFSSYISVHNESSQTVNEVNVKADLQTGTQRISLSGQSAENVVDQLIPGESIDDVVHHEVKEIGTHILVCAVSYLNEAGEKMYFRKFFKFQVMKPLDVKTKFYNAEDYTSDEVYLEAQIQNITSSPISLEKVALDPSQLFTAKQLNSLQDGSDLSVFGNVNCLNPEDSRQYLYCLRPKPDVSSNAKQLRGALNIGKLDIVWRTNMGERGRLQTSQLQRMAPGYGDIRLTIEEMPEVVVVETPFTIKCKISNLCDRAMDLILMLDSSHNSGLIWTGVSGKPIGKLEPHCSSGLQLDLVPTETGLQVISGIKLKDMFLRRTYDHDEVAQVFVVLPE